jgi:hypothetical protein
MCTIWPKICHKGASLVGLTFFLCFRQIVCWLGHPSPRSSHTYAPLAGQIEYWATLGRIAELAGLTVSEAGDAIKLYDARQDLAHGSDSLDHTEAEFAMAQATGRLAQVARQAVQANRREAVKVG